MKNKESKVLVSVIAVILVLLIATSGVTLKKYVNYSSENVTSQPSNSAETKAEKEEDDKMPSERKIRILAANLSEKSGNEITEEMLNKLDSDVLFSILENKDSITLENWHDYTGYTINAFMDALGTGESIDKGNNGKDYFELGFTGDINFTETGYVMTHAKYMENGVLDCIDETFQNEMKSVDIMLINNEFPYTDRGTPTSGKKYTFHASPSYVHYLNDMGVDIVSLANNHTYDYGYESFVDTIATLNNANIPFVGAGMNIDEASKPVTFIINGYKVAYLASSGVESPIKTPVATEDSEGIMGSYDGGELLCEKIREAKKSCDIVIVYPHWGMENTTALTNAQKTNARKYIDAGATAVIGNHSHCLQGMEFYNGAPIIYSLGNFWFNTRDVYTGLLKLKFTGSDMEMTLVPGRQANSETHYLEDESERLSLYRKIESWEPYNKITIDDNGVIRERND